MLNVVLKDSSNSNTSKISSRGELVVGKLAFSEAYNATADVINTAYSVIAPKTKQRFLITDILIYANKNVGVNDATIYIYEASGPDITTVTKSILNTEIKASTSRDLTGLNLIITEGVWVNVKTDDDDVFFTIMGYYVHA